MGSRTRPGVACFAEMSATSSAQITLRALVTSRWVLLGLLALSGILVELDPKVLAVSGWLPVHPGVVPFLALLGSWAAINIATDRVVLAAGKATSQLAGIHLLVDALMLTVLLSMSGGATNAFTTLYFVPITLATQVSPRWTWALAVSSLACFASLFVLHPIPTGPSMHQMHFVGHLRGMWVAFAVTGALMTYFVHSIALSLARQREELIRLREHALESRHLGALGSLAAGAAHELGTPLGSIELLVAELPHMNESDRKDAISTVRGQVARCKTILQRMASPELRVAALGELGSEPWPLAKLRSELGDPPGGVEIDVEDATAGAETELPRELLGQVLRELVANATNAGAERVEVRIGTEHDSAMIEVKGRRQRYVRGACGAGIRSVLLRPRGRARTGPLPGSGAAAADRRLARARVAPRQGHHGRDLRATSSSASPYAAVKQL